MKGKRIMDDEYAKQQKRLRLELLKLRSSVRTTTFEEWIDRALGIIEREKVQELERFKERQFGWPAVVGRG